MRKIRTANIILLLASILLAILALELAVRISGAAEATLPLFNISALITPSANPNLGYLLTPDAADGLYAINSQGFRDYSYPLQKPAGTFRIIGVGDSYTFGWGVSLEDTYLKQLEQQTGAEVLNFGVPGYNTVQEIELLKEKAIAYQPDMVIVGYLLNDAEGAISAESVAPQHPAGGLPLPPALKSFLSRNLHSYRFLAARFHQLLMKLGIRESTEQGVIRLYANTPEWLTALNALDELASISKQRNFIVVFVIIPYLYRLDAYPYTTIHNQLSTIAQERNFIVVDTIPSFVGRREGELHVDATDTHPNAEAHAIIASAILESLRGRLPASTQGEFIVKKGS